MPTAAARPTPIATPASREGLTTDGPPAVSQQEGLLWKVWTENPVTATAGGVYLFADEQSARRYVDKHTARLAGFGITGIDTRSFAVNEKLSQTTYAALERPGQDRRP
ncbi:MAG TPA: YdhR family protein [Nakamurella sp.]